LIHFRPPYTFLDGIPSFLQDLIGSYDYDNQAPHRISTLLTFTWELWQNVSGATAFFFRIYAEYSVLQNSITCLARTQTSTPPSLTHRTLQYHLQLVLSFRADDDQFILNMGAWLQLPVDLQPYICAESTMYDSLMRYLRVSMTEDQVPNTLYRLREPLREASSTLEHRFLSLVHQRYLGTLSHDSKIMRSLRTWLQQCPL